MGGNKHKKSSSSSSSSSSSGFFSIFSFFKSSNKKNRGGHYYDHQAYDSGRKIWPSDEDKGRWGVAEPGIDMKAEAFIANYKKRVSESSLYQLDPSAENA